MSTRLNMSTTFELQTSDVSRTFIPSCCAPVEKEASGIRLIQWSLDLMKCEGTKEIGLLYRGFVISRFFFTHCTITGLKNIVRYIEDFII